MSDPIIEMTGMTKRFGALAANDNVSISVSPGEIVGLLGENGAGKTTLMNVLFGVYRPDSGSIRVDGKPVNIRNSAEALKAGIGMVHQHFHLAPRLTVLENLLVGYPGRCGMLDAWAGREGLKHIAESFGLRLNPDQKVGTLSLGEQQRLEIVKALFLGARLLILDEPTAVLTPQDVEGLFAALRAIAARGLGIIFISHKLNEVRALTSRCVVLRQGKVVGEIAKPSAATPRQIAELMCGQEILPAKKPHVMPGEAVLTLDRISTRGAPGMNLHDVSLAIHAGEILGIAGVSGNGQKALADVTSGVVTPTSGFVSVMGKTIRKFDPKEMMRLGVGRIPEDRLAAGLVSNLSLAESMVLPRAGQRPFSTFGKLDRKAIMEFAQAQIEAFDIRCNGPSARTGTLSGGNLQKALLARELAFDPKVVVVSQPTRGLDMAATQFVHERFLSLRSAGRGILLVSEDLEELLALSDRIAVLYEGRVIGTLAAAEASVSKLGLLMSGAREQAA